MMTNEKNIAEQILKYLGKRPEAGDTLEGIATWWLRQQQIDESVELIRQAIQELKAGGVISEQKTAQGSTVYSLKKGE
jgi:NADH:ubiquinone oxidoreductase subunit D